MDLVLEVNKRKEWRHLPVIGKFLLRLETL